MYALYAECDVLIGDASTTVDTEKVELPKQEPERKSLLVSSLSSSRSLPPTEKFLPDDRGRSARPKPTLSGVSNWRDIREVQHLRLPVHIVQGGLTPYYLKHPILVPRLVLPRLRVSPAAKSVMSITDTASSAHHWTTQYSSVEPDPTSDCRLFGAGPSAASDFRLLGTTGFWKAGIIEAQPV